MRHNDRDIATALQRVTDAADAFVNRAPRVKRIEGERTALLHAITDAQLVLSVHRLPEDKRRGPASKAKRTSLLEEQIKIFQATLNELEQRLQPLTSELEELQAKTEKARAMLGRALKTPKFLDKKEAA